MHVEVRPWVVKIGGRLCDDPAIRQAVGRACATAGVPVVLVHGGGCVVSAWQAQGGPAPRFVEGRRVTAAADMPMIEMALSGSLNKDLVRALLAAGCLAAGCSGIDANLVRCRLVPELGAVGLPEVVQTHLLTTLLAAGVTPVLSPVSAGPDGAPVNVNADEFACAVATALRAERLLLVSDVEAVQVAGHGRDMLTVDDVEPLIDCGAVHGGMVPKLRAAVRAVHAGVSQVHIGAFARSWAEVAGTAVVAVAPRSVCHAG